MGANEKLQAAMHGHTPSELALITAWVDQRRNLLEYNGEPFEGVVERTSQAQRTIEKIRAEAKAEALEDAATEWERLCKIGDSPRGQITEEELFEFCQFHAQSTEEWLRNLANQYKERP